MPGGRCSTAAVDGVWEMLLWRCSRRQPRNRRSPCYGYAMQVTATDIPEVKLIVPPKHGDHRGFFSETYNRQRLADAGIAATFVQDNHSLSAQKGVVRGLHFQTPPHAQAKLIRVLAGKVIDVAVDIRHGSPTFGQHVAVELSDENWQQLYIPAGFAHGFVTLTPNVEVFYKVTDFYAPNNDAGIAWDDPALGINWRVDPADAVLSEKDQKLPRLGDLPGYFEYGNA